MDFSEEETKNGVRFSWNYWPTTNLGANRIVIPLGAMYTPLKNIQGIANLDYSPIVCKACSSMINPFVIIDYKSKVWVCPFCGNRNLFPQSYSENITETNLPYELMKNNTTIEYIRTDAHDIPIYLFIIDTNVREAELKETIESIR